MLKVKNKLSGALCATAHYWHQSAFQQWLQRIKGPCRFQPFLDLHRNPVYWSPSVLHSGIRLFPLFWPLTLCPKQGQSCWYTKCSSEFNLVRREGWHKHHALLPSVNETLSQRSFKVFTLAADLCSARRAMSRWSISNLNTTLQWSWLWLCLPRTHQSDWSQAKQSLCSARQHWMRAGTMPDGRWTSS